MRTVAAVMLIAIVLVVGCVPATEISTNVSNETPGNESAMPPTVTPPPAKEETKVLYTIEKTEGELVQLKPEAIDPDGDRITFTFTKPFDKEGRWQTGIGDEGSYDVVVGASDGRSETTQTVRVVVRRANRPPVIECAGLTFNEGELIDLAEHCKVTDEDDKDVVVAYTGWMTATKYQTTYDDAGRHIITITASDRSGGKTLHTVTKEWLVTVKNIDRPPVFSDKFPAQISANENDVITIPRDLVSDPDGDQINITYSAPFNKDGVWKTKLGDAGTYDVDVVASDGTETAKVTVKVLLKMLNTAPVLKEIPGMSVKEGETIRLPISAYDREGDTLTTTISGWMTGDTYKTTYDDAGNYTAKVTVSDGVFNTSQVVHITVLDVNRPPVFVLPG